MTETRSMIDGLSYVEKEIRYLVIDDVVWSIENVLC